MKNKPHPHPGLPPSQGEGTNLVPSPSHASDFYAGHLGEGGQEALASARGLEGLEAEIAVLRTLLRDLLAHGSDNPGQVLKAADTLARLVNAQHRLSGRQQQSLKDAIGRVLTEIALPIGDLAAKAILRR
jgi:hypothetical protein